MAHSHSYPQAEEKLELGSGAQTFMVVAAVIGVVGIAVALSASLFMYTGTGGGIRRFWFSYLIGFAFFLSLAIGGLFFTLLHYVIRAGWSTSVRRVPEAMARALPLFLILAVPLMFSILKNDGALYRWAQEPAAHNEEAKGEAHAEGQAHEGETAGMHAEHAGESAEAAGTHEGSAKFTDGQLGNTPGAYPIPDPMPLVDGKPLQPDHHLVTPKKDQFLLLSTKGVLTSMVVSLGGLSLIAYWYTGKSRRQDATGDKTLTIPLNKRAAPALVFFGVAVTAIAFHFLMSLDPKWFSTMFGPYYFAGSAVSNFAFVILVLKFLQSKGYLGQSVGRDHFHDLGKWTFAFTFFWGYLAFSQYMLLWYSSQPEEIEWLARRGASTAHTHLETFGPYMWVSMALLFCKLLIPFAGLLSRHVKRFGAGLIFWAVWVLLAHSLDIYWIVMPELDGAFHFGIPEIASWIGVGGLFLAMVTWSLKGAALRPINDPRAEESLAFHQSF